MHRRESAAVPALAGDPNSGEPLSAEALKKLGLSRGEPITLVGTYDLTVDGLPGWVSPALEFYCLHEERWREAEPAGTNRFNIPCGRCVGTPDAMQFRIVAGSAVPAPRAYDCPVCELVGFDCGAHGGRDPSGL